MIQRIAKSNALIAAAVQLRPGDSIEHSLNNAFVMIQRAVDKGAELVVLPENFAHLGCDNFNVIGQAESTPQGVVRQFLSNQARQQNIWLVAGTLPISDAGGSKPFARSLLFDPQGKQCSSYDKIHLFDVALDKTELSDEQQSSYRESDNFSAGSEIVVAQTDFCTLGMTVCYDLRFAELYRQLADQGAQIVTVPAAFTAATGRDHWLLLLRARAVENQLFMIGANMVDRKHPRRALWGGSAIIDPWGNVLVTVEDEPGVAVAEIDLSMIDKVRARMPVAEHRKI
jgi:deaminated glutathione amidase